MAKKTNNNNNQTSNIPTGNMQSASVKNAPNTNEVNKAVESARKAIEDLGDSVKKTNTDLKELNNQLGKRSRANNVKKLLDEIEKLAGVLDELGKVEVPTDKVNEIQTTLDKLTKTKFNTTEITKVTNVLANFNTELSTLSTHLRNLNNIDVKKVESLTRGSSFKYRDTIKDKETKFNILDKKHSEGILNQKGIEDYYKAKKDFYQALYNNTDPNDEQGRKGRDNLLKIISDIESEKAKDIEEYKNKVHAQNVSDAEQHAKDISLARSYGISAAAQEKADTKRKDSIDKLIKFEDTYAEGLEDLSLSLEKYEEWTQLQVDSDLISPGDKAEFDRKYKEKLKALEKTNNAEKDLAEFEKVFADRLREGTLSLERFKDWVNLQVDAGRISGAHGDNMVDNHKQRLQDLKPDLEKQKARKELIDLLSNQDTLGRDDRQKVIKLQKFLGDITGIEADRQLEYLKKTFKQDDYKKEFDELSEIKDRDEKQEKRYRDLKELLGLLTAVDRANQEKMEKELKLNEELLKLESISDKSSDDIKKIRNIKVELGKISKAEAEREIEALRQLKKEEDARLRRQASAGIFSAGRGLIAQRGKDRHEARLDLDAKLLESERANRKKNAGARIADKLTGKLGLNDTSLLSDIGELTGLISKDTDTITALKLKQKELKDEQASKIYDITQDEMNKKGLILRDTISDDDKKYLIDNSEDKSQERVDAINSGKLTFDDKEKLLNKLTKESSEKRKKINEEYNDKLVENEELTAGATNKLAGKLTLALTAIKATAKAVKELAKVSNEAAQSQAQLISNLKSMGAESNTLDSKAISGYTNELKSIQAHWINIKNDVGDGLLDIGSGFLTVVDEILDAVDDLGELFGTNKSNTSDQLAESTNKSSVKMLKIVEKLEKGINGIVVDRETSSNALNSLFSAFNSTGIDNTSAGNLTSLISDMAVDIAKEYGVNYEVAMQQLQDAIMNGGNSAAQYGINVDEQTLTGWAANTKGLDLVNVGYTDAYKAVLRFQLAQEEMTDGNSDAMTKQIKRWKQLGDVIQTASGTLFDFQEVQTMEAKDFTIPEVDAQGNIAQSITGTNQEQLDQVDKLNDKVKETGILYVMTAEGAMTLADAYDYLNGDLSQLRILYDEANKRYVLATEDYLPSLTQAEQELFTLLEEKGIMALALYCDQLGLSAFESQKVAEKAGLSEGAIKLLGDAINQLDAIEVDYSDLEEVKRAADEARQAIENMYAAKGMEANLDKGTLYNSQLSKYSEPIQDYITNGDGYEFSDGTTIDDMSLIDWLFNGEKRAAFNDFYSIGKGETTYGYTVDEHEYSSTGINDRLKSVGTVPGMANGGISTKAHLTAISEDNANEAVIPLDSSVGINALSSAMQIALGGVGGGVNIENLNINNEGINIAENENQWRQVGNRIYEEISTIQRERGDMNYGIK